MSQTDSAPAENVLRMELPSTVELLPVIRTALAVFLERVVRRPDLVERTELPVVEAVVNAIRHGNREDPARPVGVELLWRPPRLTVAVEDEGEPFELRIPEEMAASLEDHGRGLFLMARMSDALRVERRSGGNRVKLEWLVPEPGGGPDQM